MKINKFLMGLGAIAALSLAACSNDEPNNPTPEKPGNGQSAYMKVSIKSASGMSRATTTPGYEDGNESEHKVNSVRFYFFDETGASMDLTAYLTKGDGTIVVNPEGNKNNTVEAVFGENLLVLEKMTSNKYPTYMVTVINRPDFKVGTNLDNTLQLLDNCKNGDYFVMSTSSYKGESDHHDNKYYHATKLTKDDFKTTAAAAVAQGSTVSVYVERLAAKVELDLASQMKSEVVTLEGGEKIYKLEQTVAGGNNTENDTENQLGTQLYIRVLGWDLNTTAIDSYMCKNIDTNWNLNWDTNGSWDAGADFRSFWAKSYIYGDKLDAVNNKLSYVNTGSWVKDSSKPFSLTEIGNTPNYCNENTNKLENIYNDGAVDNRLVTHAVLYTQVCDVEGNAVELVKANGVLFVSDSYKQYIINRAYAMAGSTFNIWKQTGSSSSTTEDEEGTTTSTTNTYAQIGTEYFDLVKPTTPEGIGDVDIIVKEDAFTGTFYKKNADNTYTEMTADELTAAIAALKTAIANAEPENHAVMFGNGKSVYYIPVEHLGNLANSDAVEGSYGVVRNHWYKLTVSKFSKVGHGIWDPEDGEEHYEDLIPNEPEDPMYYLGADINILSWKIVNQEVEL